LKRIKFTNNKFHLSQVTILIQSTAFLFVSFLIIQNNTFSPLEIRIISLPNTNYLELKYIYFGASNTMVFLEFDQFFKNLGESLDYAFKLYISSFPKNEGPAALVLNYICSKILTA